MVRWISILCLLAVVVCAPAAMAASWEELLNRPRPAATQRFTYGAAPEQFAELWLPANKGKHAVVILLHGGCWQASIPGFGLMAHIAADLRDHGIAVWNVEYRSLGAEGAGYPGTFLDVAQGVDYLPRIAKKYNLDLSRTVVMGHSAGGQLALWAAARGHLDKHSLLYRPHPLTVKAAVSLAGVVDLRSFRYDGPACNAAETIDALISDDGKDSYADTSPAELLPLHVPQLIVTGTDDDIVPQEFGDHYAEAARKAGDKVEVLDIGGASHIDLIDPQSDAWPKIRAALMPYLK